MARLRELLEGVRMGEKDRAQGKKSFRRVCSWCKKVLDGGGKIKQGEKISHTICKDCERKYFGGL